MPTFRSAACRLITRPPRSRTSPNGTTAKVTSTGATLRQGARKCSRRSLPAGTRSSLSRNLTGSATSVLMMPRPAKPKIAARLAPIRSWISALTFRSKNTPSAITCRTSRMANTALAAASAMSRATLFARQALDQRERALHVEAFVVLAVVHLQHGGGAARGEALDFLEREAAVGRALAVADAEPRLESALDVEGTAQRTREVAAHLQVPASLRLLPVHRVEGRHRRDPRERQVHQPGDVLLDGQRQPAELALGEPEGRHERRAPLGVARQERPVLLEHGRREARRSRDRVSGHTRLR